MFAPEFRYSEVLDQDAERVAKLQSVEEDLVPSVRQNDISGSPWIPATHGGAAVIGGISLTVLLLACIFGIPRLNSDVALQNSQFIKDTCTVCMTRQGLQGELSGLIFFFFPDAFFFFQEIREIKEGLVTVAQLEALAVRDLPDLLDLMEQTPFACRQHLVERVPQEALEARDPLVCLVLRGLLGGQEELDQVVALGLLELQESME